MDDDSESSLLILFVLEMSDWVGKKTEPFLPGIDIAFDLLSGGNSNSCNEVEFTLLVSVTGASSTEVNVDQREGAEFDDEGTVGEETQRLSLVEGEGKDLNFFNLAFCLCLKVSKKWRPGEGLLGILGLDFLEGLSTRLLSLLYVLLKGGG